MKSDKAETVQRLESLSQLAETISDLKSCTYSLRLLCEIENVESPVLAEIKLLLDQVRGAGSPRIPFED